MEMEKVPAAGYAIEGLRISGLKRSLSLDNLSFPFKVGSSLLKARGILKRFKPQVCIGVGGYASGPLLQAAVWQGIPTLIQEQNGFAGVTNKLLAKKVNRICVAYEGMEKFFPADKLVLTGNPVRADIVNITHTAQEGRQYYGLKPDVPTVLFVGGSLGALTLNESVVAHIETLAQANMQLLWQTGNNFHTRAQALLQQQDVQNIVQRPFLDRMDYAYAAADVIVSRAGALSISELCLVGKPAILVPSPNVAEDHQTHNALSLSGRGAALLVRDGDARRDLVPKALELLQNSGARSALQSAISSLGKPDATKHIVNELEFIAMP